MTAFKRLDSLKDELAQCPICVDFYNEQERIPRRLPCCGQLTCEPCLQSYTKGARRTSCLLCRKELNLPGGVKALPKDMTVLRFLDVYNDVADESDRTRESVVYSRDSPKKKPIRKIIPSEFTEKLEMIKAKIKELAEADDNIKVSRKSAADRINESFDHLNSELQQRRQNLLELVDLTAEKEEKLIIRAIESHKDKQQLIEEAIETSSWHKLPINLDPTEDIPYVRRGINFIEHDVEEIGSAIKSAGCIRTISYMPREKPKHLEASSPCAAVSIGYTKSDQDSIFDHVMVVGRNPILCPHLVYDHSTASSDVLTAGREITNTGSDPNIPHTGCRLLRKRSIFLSRPLRFSSFRRQMFLMKLNVKLKQNVPERVSIWGTHCTDVPDDMNSSQLKGFDLDIASCTRHETLCLRLLYDRKLIGCNPFMTNQAGKSREMTLGVVFNSENRCINVFDVIHVVPLDTVSEVDFRKPIWTMVTLGRPTFTEIKTEIISGRDVTLSSEMMDMMSQR